MQCPKCLEEVKFKEISDNFILCYKCPKCGLKLSMDEVSVYNKNTDFEYGVQMLADKEFRSKGKAPLKTLHVLYQGDTLVGIFKNKKNAETFNKLNGNTLNYGEIATDLK